MSAETDKRVIGILVNDDFINYVLNPTISMNEKWDDFFRMHPEQIPIANQARLILLGRLNKKTLPFNEMIEMKSRIFEKCGLSPLS